MELLLHAVQNLVPSRFLSNNLRLKIYRSVTLSVARNFVSHPGGSVEVECVQKGLRGAMWTEERGRNVRLQKITL